MANQVAIVSGSSLFAPGAHTAGTYDNELNPLGAGKAYVNYFHESCEIIVDVTNVTGSVTVSLLGYDPVSGKTWTVLSSAAIAAASTVVLQVSPQIPAAANQAARDFLPPNYIVRVVVATGPATFTVAMNKYQF